MSYEAADLTRLMVLKAIRRQGPISRVELAAVTGLAGSTITETTADLVRRGLLTEERAPRQGKGRARMLLSIDPSSLAVVGASLDAAGTLEVSLVDLGGRRIHTLAYPLERAETADGLVRMIATKLQNFIAELGDFARIGYVGLSLPALLRGPEGIVSWLPTLVDTDVPAGQMLTDWLGYPTFVENGADGLARSEHWFGNPAAPDDFTVVLIGLGLGLAEYRQGLPGMGANGFNAEFAHVKSAWGEGARPCFCGARGCLTTYASISGILRTAAQQADKADMTLAGQPQSFAALAASAKNGEAFALAAFQEAAGHLGIALANLVNYRDPGTLLLRFADADLRQLLEPELLAVLEANCLPPIFARTLLDISVISPEWRFEGAAALALERTYLAAPRRSLNDQSSHAEPPAHPERSDGEPNLRIVNQRT